MASNRMSAALSVLMTHNFSKMFLRAEQAFEFSHDLDPKLTLVTGNESRANADVFRIFIAVE